MPDILTTIIEHKKTEVRQLRERRAALIGRTDANRGFYKALMEAESLAVIAEVKKASPSKGVIAADFDPVATAERYQTGGASALSVLTDERFFQGAAQYLIDVRRSVKLPVLRKDFIIDPLQVLETATLNADAMLLIVAALSDGQLEELYSAAVEMNIEPLIEIHNGAELDRAMRIEPKLLGINNRDLHSFNIDIRQTLELILHIPREVAVISESGIFTAVDTEPLIAAGVRAVLVGEALMRAEDPARLIPQLRHLPEKA
jgi:indole-3-glycerol phosphate synthase